ncbi:MAG: LysR family transcriptional regulator [Cyanobacteria bacterium P01_C01_bin.72]
MEIYQLKVFIEVARCLNFTEAADRLNLTQPAVSAKIKSLESELKASLFHRLGRQIQLTDVGQYLVDKAEKLVELEADTSDKIAKFKQHKSNKITIGSSFGLAQSWLPKIIYQYRQANPEIKIALETFKSDLLLEKAISNNRVDLGFSETISYDYPELRRQKIGSIHYGLIVTPSGNLAKKSWHTLADIKQKRVIILSDRFASYHVFISRLAELNLTLADFNHLEIVDSIGLMRAYLTQGNYLGFASDIEFQAELDGEILTLVNLQEFALPADIYVSSLTNNKNANPKTSVNKFFALFPADSISKSAISLNRDRQKQETITINVGIQNSTIPTITTGLILQRLRLLEYFLPKTGKYEGVKYDLQWHNYLSGMPISEGLKGDQLDIGILGDYPLLQSAIPSENDSSSSSTQLVSFVSINPGGDGNAVIVPQTSKLETIEDLKDKTVALPVGSSAHGMLLRSLSHLDLLDRVQLFPLKNSQVNHWGWNMLLHQQHFRPLKTSSNSKLAEGFAYFSPFHQLATERGNYKYLHVNDLDQLPGFYGVVVSQSFANKYPEIIISYLRAMMAAQNWLANTPSAISLVSQWTKIKPKILTKILNPNNSAKDLSLFVNDSQIRSDWLLEHINRLKTVPSLEALHKIKLDRWVQPEFLEFIRQN